MEPHLRFEIIQQIAAGDYATVYKARDRELGRDVAIKQIHPQFLQDPKQLERYWQEAQLLASLEHPHIMMIYDIVRDRGWLVLELMQGSLQSLLGGRPIDLNDLRMALTYTLHALQFMHDNGIVHGDVKPSNLLVDRNSRVKLGDFGIARRLKGEHGSVVKGTTKYMAPEVVSDQFGPVGPHSDLYSLGFSAFELMCGENFESLFPGLSMFGRDRQIAWMMWHSAVDRRLPEIERVLQGVPKDLAYIITRMAEKDPAKRYRTAAQVLEDLRRQATAETTITEEQAAAAALAAKQAKRKRWLSIGAFAASLGLSLLAILWPAQQPPPAPPPAIVRPADGVVGEIDAARGIFFLKPREEGETPVGVAIDAEHDRVYLNNNRVSLAELAPDDAVTLKYLSGDGVEFKEVFATRAETAETAGLLDSVDLAMATLRLSAGDGTEPREPWYVPERTPVSLNGQSTAGPRSLALSDLRPMDRVTIRHVASDEGRTVVRSIAALRTLTVQGVAVSRNPQQSELVVDLAANAGGDGAAAGRKTFRVAAQAAVSINGKTLAGDVPLTIADLVAGDRLTITHDAQVARIEAVREVAAAGRVTDIDVSQRVLKVASGDTQGAGDSRAFAFAVPPKCEIRGAKGEPLEFEFLRVGDRVDVDYEVAAGGQLNAAKISARPVSDPRAWAVVIGQSQYDDAAWPALPMAAESAAAVATALTDRYRVPPEQLLRIANGSRLQIEQSLATLLPKIGPDSQLICYYVGHGIVDRTAGPLLVTKEFDSQRAGSTAVPLRALIKALENSPARDKILLLDTCHAVPGVDQKLEPSTAELAEAVKERPSRPVSTNVLVIASCDREQRGLVSGDGEPSLFGATIAAAFAGAADDNRDGRVAVAEFLQFLPRELAKRVGDGGKQTAVVFQPDAKPPRLTAQAREAITDMLRNLRAQRYDDSMQAAYNTALGLAPKEPDLPMAFALVLMRHNRLPAARVIVERVRLEHPKTPLAHQAIAWQDFLQGRYGDGISSLQSMVKNLPNPQLEPAAEPYRRHALQFAGALRQYAMTVADPPLSRADVETLDKAVIEAGDAAKEAFRQGIEATREALARIDGELRDAPADRIANLQLDRKRITFYTNLNYALMGDFVRHRLDE
jgi:tRNA A-37 threonylcarbamoyl transferase component Bud32